MPSPTKYLLLLLLSFSPLVFSETTAVQPAAGDFSYLLLLTQNHDAYELNTARQASGLFPCESGLTTDVIRNFSVSRHAAQKTTTLPNFRRNPHYCFLIRVQNQTAQQSWVLHFSNFYIDKIKAHVQTGEHAQEFFSDFSQGFGNTRLNVLGRGFDLHLEPNTTYNIAIELTADGIVAPPYLRLTTAAAYTSWSNNMGYIYSLAIGVIIGLILISLCCAAVLRDSTFLWFSLSSIFLLSFLCYRSVVGIKLFGYSPETSWWLWLWISALQISTVMFARAFLTEETPSARFQRLFDGTLIYFALSLALSFVLPLKLNMALFVFNGVVMMMLILLAGLDKLVRRGRYYLLFMLGWLPVLYALVELGFVALRVPDGYTSTLSYKVVREPFFQIAHMLIHFIAMLIRINELKKQSFLATMRNDAKSRFLASASHDLRQPLHSMGMFLAHLSEHIQNKSSRVLLSKVFQLHEQMNQSFGTLMELSRLEAGAEEAHIERVNLNSLLASLRVEYEPQAQSKGLNLRFYCTVNHLTTDPVLLERILRNLLSNAIKYTDRGGVLLGVRRRDQYLLIQVWDTGQGITSESRNVIFDIYQRSQHANSDHAGMGIGLAIVRHSAELLHGAITLRSRAGRGSVFELRLPAIEAPSLPAGSRETSTADRLRIVVELSETTLRSQVNACLHSWGYLASDQTASDQNAAVTLVIGESPGEADYEALVAHAQSLEARFGNVVQAQFGGTVERALAAKLTSLNVHTLSSEFRPAELRSLLRYLEAQWQQGSHA
ncbi:ATP-binding protein [Teredinibacter turnerae]|uniref:sensor histidine kinase n=1 Tax=Teredinibacter turnerae TaxID=2426 RepID=UPI0005F7CBC7|nr:ATP-binding protein [Teredinibacter turnerae]